MAAPTLLALVVAAGPAAPPDLAALEHALDAAVRKVSRARFAHVLGMGETCRSYRVPGYGAFVVLAPRILPTARIGLMAPWAPVGQAALLERAIRSLEEAMKTASPELRALMEKRVRELRVIQARLAPRPLGRARPAPGALQPDPLQEMESQFRVLEAEAERQRRDMERMFDEIERQLREGGQHAPFPVGDEPHASLPLPAAPQARHPLATPSPQAPAASEASATEQPAVAESPPSPPWVSWFETEGLETATPDAVVSEVRGAVLQALAERGAAVRGLASDEHLVVAVDFFSRGVFASNERPLRTLVVKARFKDLEARHAGSLSAAELGERIEVLEY
jgi:hypothetical protein